MTFEQGNQQHSNTICNELYDLLPAYSMGITDSHETQFVEENLHQCPELQAELTQFYELSDLMLLSSPQLEPPKNLVQNVIQQSQLAKTPSKQTLVRINLWRLATVAALALLIISNLFWVRRLQQVESQPTQVFLNSQGNLTTFADFQRSQYRNIEVNEVVRVELSWTASAPDQRWLGLFEIENIPILEVGKTYQAWLIRDNEAPTSIGVFQVNETGRGQLVFEITQPIGSYNIIGITIEPEGGSPAPTSDPIAAGNI